MGRNLAGADYVYYCPTERIIMTLEEFHAKLRTLRPGLPRGYPRGWDQDVVISCLDENLVRGEKSEDYPHYMDDIKGAVCGADERGYIDLERPDEHKIKVSCALDKATTASAAGSGDNGAKREDRRVKLIASEVEVPNAVIDGGWVEIREYLRVRMH